MARLNRTRSGRHIHGQNHSSLRQIEIFRAGRLIVSHYVQLALKPVPGRAPGSNHPSAMGYLTRLQLELILFNLIPQCIPGYFQQPGGLGLIFFSHFQRLLDHLSFQGNQRESILRNFNFKRRTCLFR